MINDIIKNKDPDNLNIVTSPAPFPPKRSQNWIVSNVYLLILAKKDSERAIKLTK